MFMLNLLTITRVSTKKKLLKARITQHDLFQLITLSKTTKSTLVLTNCDLRDLFLSGLDLETADLSGSNMNGMNLTSTNFANANLCGTSLIKSNLTNANLQYQVEIEPSLPDYAIFKPKLVIYCKIEPSLRDYVIFKPNRSAIWLENNIIPQTWFYFTI